MSSSKRQDRRRSRTQVAARDQRAVELAARGCTTEQIATELGYANRSGAYKAIIRGLEATATDNNALRMLHLERCERLINKLWDSATADTPNLAAIDRITQLLGHEARIAGLYVTRSEISVTDNTALSDRARDRLSASVDVAAALDRIADHQPIIETEIVEPANNGGDDDDC